MKKFKLLTIIASIFIGINLSGQPSEIQLANIEIPTPEIASLGKFIDIPVGHFTGAPSTNIPIYTLVEGPLQVSISVNNHGSGIRASESASWVGAGWSLNAGGVISRVVQGLPDETPTEGYLNHSKDYLNPNVLDQVATGITDGEPDLFSFSFPGGSGKFIINKNIDWAENHQVELFPHSDLKIDVDSLLEEFIITTTDGTKYYFGEKNSDDYAGFTLVQVNGVVIRSSSAQRQQTEWHLRKIESHDEEFVINFTYREETYGVVSPTAQQLAYVYSAFSTSLIPDCAVDPFNPFNSICTNIGSIFTYDGGFGPSGLIESPGNFQILGPNNGRTTYPLYATFQGYESKFISTITTSTTRVTFHESTSKRDDVNSYPYTTSIIADELPYHNFGALDRIDIRPLSIDPIDNSLAFCKEYKFTYDYFQGVDNPIYTFDKRLKLNSIQESACGPSGPEVPAYTFQYYENPSKSYPFLPWRLTQAIDSWGYYNGVTTNDNKKYNIPQINLSVQYPSSSAVLTKSTSDAGYSTADRNSYGGPMLYGALQKVYYPEGGYTELQMEANTVKQVAYDTIIGTPSTPMMRFASCDFANPEGTLDPCCPNSQTKEKEYTISSQYIERGVIEMCMTDVGCVDDAVSGPGSNPIWVGTFSVSLRRKSDNVYVGQKNFNHTADTCITMRMTEAFPGLLTSTPGQYIMSIQSGFAHGEVTFKEEQYIDISFNKTVGGLRIADKRTYDSQNNLMLSKSYDYNQESDPSFSSGKLYSEPLFGGIVNTGQINEINVSTPTNYYYLKFMFRNVPHIPLTDYQGYHIGYTNVKESQANGAYTKYKFNAVNLYEEAPVYNDPILYPLAPFPYFYDNGILEYTASGTSNDVISSSGNNTGVVTRTFTENKAVRVEKITSDNGAHELLIPNYFSYDETGFARRYNSVDTIDGMPSAMTYTYDPSSRHLFPIATTTTNSNGDLIINHIKYPFEAQDDSNLQSTANAELLTRNMIVPIEQTEEVGGQIVRGNQMIYKLFGGDPYVEELYNYEITYDANGNRIEGSQPWQLLETINAYSSKGQPTQVTRRGWESQFLYWNPNNHLLDSVRFKDFKWEYTYHHSSLLLESKKDIDGQVVNYEFDFLERLEKISARNGNVETDFEYFYKNQNGTRPENHTITTQTITPEVSGKSQLQSLVTYNYLDEIGRPVQTIQQGYSQNLKDIITATEYDEYGRPYRVYEPFEYNQNNGHYVLKTNWPDSAKNHFTLTEYEDSPLNRKIAVTPPRWYPTQYEYGTNNLGITIAGVNYPANSLIFQKTIDPDNNEDHVYTDRKGRQLMMVRKGLGSGEEAKTQYLYDDKDRVALIVPPDVDISSYTMAFRYLYDKRDNMISKLVPDQSGWTNYLYDDRDLVTYMQDPVMENQGRWLHTYYDGYGREEKTGFVNTVLNIDPTQTSNFDEILTQNYYDGYDFSGGAPDIYVGKLRRSDVKILGTNDWITSFSFYDSYGRVDKMESNHHLNLSDLQAEVTNFGYDFSDNLILQNRVHTRLDGSTTSIEDESHYDHSGRFTKAFHQIDGGTKVQLNELIYTQKDQIELRNIGKVGSSFLQQATYEYLPNRFLKSINSTNLSGTNNPLPICNNNLPSQATASSNVANNALFYMELGYDKQLITDANPVIKNGNISQMIWRVRGRDRQLYSYKYDYLNRIREADYYDVNGSNGKSSDGKYNTTINYQDKRGNISTITRNSYVWDGSCWSVGQIDNLSFNYHSSFNRLKDVTDNAPSTYRDKGYKYYDPGTADYAYDDNGNMTYDPSKAISVSYNHLNMPTIVEFSDCKIIEFVYNAGGGKLSKIVRQEDNVIKRKDYLGEIEYVNNTIDAIYHSEGRVYYENGVGRYEYNLTDHLGNVRLSFTDKNGNNKVDATDDPESNEILSEMHYYPFGMTMEGPWMQNVGRENPYLYNGKELNEEFGLDWLSYGAREYDPAISRWMAVDPLSEAYAGWSPYNFVMNRPTSAIDPDGQLVIFINGFFGTFTGACCGGTEDYWGDKWVTGVLRNIRDYKARFYDGSIGGLGGFSYNYSFKNRRAYGYSVGKSQAEDIVNSLARDSKDPQKIIESVKFITNSMGAAYQRGFSQALTDYVSEYNKNNPDNQLSGFEIEFTVDVAAFQGKSIGADNNATTSYFMRSIDDIVAGYEGAKIEGGVELATDSKGNSLVKKHISYIPVTISDEFGTRTVQLPRVSRPHHSSWWRADFFPRSFKNDYSVRQKTIEYEQN